MIPTIKRAFFEVFKPPPELTPADWAEQERRLSPESSAEPGRWYNRNAPYAVEPMNALGPGDPCEEVVCMFAAQTGKTEILNNAVGFFIDLDPGPILVIQPTLKPMGEAWSKDRLAPMVRDTPALRAKVKDSKERASGNTIMHKSFPGGHITIGGANSPSGLASRPIRYLLLDEINRYEVTKEGDSVKLATKRTQTFWNRKIGKFSTPTDEGVGISVEWKQSRQHEWQLQCLHCNEYQFPTLKHFNFEKTDTAEPYNIRYVCEHCGAEHTEKDEHILKKRGKYIVKNEASPKKKGFRVSQFSSNFATWKGTLTEFLEATGDPEKLKTFTNTALCEDWKGTGEILDYNVLYNRREVYDAEVPRGTAVLVMGVDVQSDRLEYEIIGFAEDHENWSIEYGAIMGDPMQNDVWQKLLGVKNKSFTHESGHKVQIAACCVDSGYLTDFVYSFCFENRFNGFYAVKGVEGAGAPIVARANKVKIKGTGKQLQLYTVGAHTAKDAIFGRLNLDEGAVSHWPIDYDIAYFKGLTAEKKVTKKRRGFTYHEYEKIRPRNEPVDTRVYCYAALGIANPNWQQLSSILETAPEIVAQQRAAKPKRQQNPRYQRKGL